MTDAPDLKALRDGVAEFLKGLTRNVDSIKALPTMEFDVANSGQYFLMTLNGLINQRATRAEARDGYSDWRLRLRQLDLDIRAAPSKLRPP